MTRKKGGRRRRAKGSWEKGKPGETTRLTLSLNELFGENEIRVEKIAPYVMNQLAEFTEHGWVDSHGEKGILISIKNFYIVLESMFKDGGPDENEIKFLSEAMYFHIILKSRGTFKRSDVFLQILQREYFIGERKNKKFKITKKDYKKIVWDREFIVPQDANIKDFINETWKSYKKNTNSNFEPIQNSTVSTGQIEMPSIRT